MVDLEAAQGIELLPDRETETLVKWLQAHPGIQIISRDRAGAYAQAARRGAPRAIQVADRWHLFNNLSTALTTLFGRHRRALRQVKALTDVVVDQPIPAPPQSTAYQRRQARFEQVRQLREEGLTLAAIAHQLQLDRKTLRRYVEAARCPDGQHSRGRQLAPYQAYLLRHGLDGQRTIRQLWRDIQAQGYTGGLSTVATFMAAARYPSTVPPPAPLTPRPPRTTQTAKLTPRRATWLFLARAEDLTDAQSQQAQQIAQLHPEITQMVTEAQTFAAILRHRTVEAFDGWLQRARLSPIRELRTFARGIQRDYAAVKAALVLPYSNGMVEGQVNRLKFVKRSMFGRAKFDLLRLRVLVRPPSLRHQICT